LHVELAYASWGVRYGLLVLEHELNSAPLFSRSEEVLPLLESHLKIIASAQTIRPGLDYALSQACIAMVLVDPRFRSSFQGILDEIKAKSKLTHNPFFGGLKRFSASSDLPDDSWREISLHLLSINEIDPQIAQLIYERVLKMHRPPPWWLPQFSVP
jgi:hypothetical protein